MGTVREALADTERKLAEAEATLEWAQGRYEEAFAIREGLRLAKEKYSLGLDDEVDPSPGA